MTTESVAAQAEVRAAGLPALVGASPVLPLLLLVPLLMRARSSDAPSRSAQAVRQDVPEPPAAPAPEQLRVRGTSAGARRSLPDTITATNATEYLPDPNDAPLTDCFMEAYIDGLYRLFGRETLFVLYRDFPESVLPLARPLWESPTA